MLASKSPGAAKHLGAAASTSLAPPSVSLATAQRLVSSHPHPQAFLNGVVVIGQL
jgi:hypothetical protein